MHMKFNSLGIMSVFIIPQDEKDGFISAASALPSLRRRDELLGCEAVKSGGVQVILKLGRSFPFVS